MVAGQMEAEEVTGAAVGRRVSCGGERATVRYVGPVPPTAGELMAEVKGHLQASVQLSVAVPPGVWLGLEWDEPSRGKHDGSHDGVQYFSCRYQPGRTSRSASTLVALMMMMMVASPQTPSGGLLRPAGQGVLGRGLRDGGAAPVPDGRRPSQPGRQRHRVEGQGAQVRGSPPRLLRLLPVT